MNLLLRKPQNPLNATPDTREGVTNILIKVNEAIKSQDGRILSGKLVIVGNANETLKPLTTVLSHIEGLLLSFTFTSTNKYDSIYYRENESPVNLNNAYDGNTVYKNFVFYIKNMKEQICNENNNDKIVYLANFPYELFHSIYGSLYYLEKMYNKEYEYKYDKYAENFGISESISKQTVKYLEQIDTTKRDSEHKLIKETYQRIRISYYKIRLLHDIFRHKKEENLCNDNPDTVNQLLRSKENIPAPKSNEQNSSLPPEQPGPNSQTTYSSSEVDPNKTNLAYTQSDLSQSPSEELTSSDQGPLNENTAQFPTTGGKRHSRRKKNNSRKSNNKKGGKSKSKKNHKKTKKTHKRR
jgi:hypothetical protein